MLPPTKAWEGRLLSRLTFPPHERGAPTSVRLPLGRRILANKPGEPIGMPMNLLEKHTLVLAGAGSGKTVLLKRLIEESLILGIPSIVIDCANDLATLDEEWSPHPAEWGDEDRQKAEQYHRKKAGDHLDAGKGGWEPSVLRAPAGPRATEPRRG